MEKVVKIVIGIFIVILLIYVIKGNIRLEKEDIISENKSDVLELESSIVYELVNSLMLDEVNNRCNYMEGKCYINSNYLYMYYKDRIDKISTDELMYLEFANYYKDNKYMMDNDYIKINSRDFEDNFKNKYGIDCVPNLYKGNDYVYTGDYYIFKNEGKVIDEKIDSKVYKAIKDKDYIHLYVESNPNNGDIKYNTDFIFILKGDEYILDRIEKV